MRFTIAAVALFAGAAVALPGYEAPAEVTVYETEIDTITSCGPTITNCPGKATETAPPAAVTTIPAGPELTTSTVYTTSEIVTVYGESTVTITSVIALYTTICPVTATEVPVAPETTAVPAVPETPVAPVVPVPATTEVIVPAVPTPAPIASGVPTPISNGTSVVTPTIAPFEGAASTYSASFGFAGLLAAVVVLFA